MKVYLFRPISIVVCLMMLLSICGLSAQFGGGEGTEENPWQISRAEHLDRLRDYLGADHNDKHFVQTADIHLGVAPWNEGEGWVPLGNSNVNSFRGKYDGNNFLITNLTIDRGASYQGLFGVVYGAAMENIHLRDVNVRAISWGNNAGLVGLAVANSVFKRCSVTGSVTGNTAANQGWMSGGMIGSAINCTIIECYTNVRVIGWTRCGGLVGWLNASHITNSFSLGQVTASGVTGGLVGLLMRHDTGVGEGSIRNSYSRANVSVGGGNQAGGLIGTVGNGTIINCFATGQVTGTGGGLIGQSNTQNTVTDSYWDTETTGKENSAGGGQGKLTRQMVYPYDLNEAYVRWDFEEIWRQDTTFENEVNPGTNDGYLYLYFQDEGGEPPIVLDPPSVAINITEIEGTNYIRLSWDGVENAVTYKIYASDFPADEDWGEPVAVTDETQYSGAIGGRKFYYVVASTDELP